MKRFHILVSTFLLGTFLLLMAGDAAAAVLCATHYRMRTIGHCGGTEKINTATVSRTCCGKSLVRTGVQRCGERKDQKAVTGYGRPFPCPLKKLLSQPAGRSLQSVPVVSSSFFQVPITAIFIADPVERSENVLLPVAIYSPPDIILLSRNFRI